MVTQPARLRRFGTALLANTRKLAAYFFGFAALGYLLCQRFLKTDPLRVSEN